MGIKIAYKLKDGGVALIHPAPGFEIEEVARRDVPFVALEDGVISNGVLVPLMVKAGDYNYNYMFTANGIQSSQAPYVLIDESKFPADRLLRDSWGIFDDVILEDTQKAIQIAHDIRRLKREEELAPLDKKVNSAIGNSEMLSAFEADRQEIREKYKNIQEDIDSCESAADVRSKLYENGLA